MAPQAALFDSGGVLIGPSGGRWNPRADFESNLLVHHPDLADDAVEHAIAIGDVFLDSGDHDYREYYRTILRALDVDPTEDLLDALLPDRPATDFVEAYPEVLDVI